MAGGWSAIEKSLRAAGAGSIAGVDEVGRGPLAGPVVVCAVIMPHDRRAISGVTDSKQLTAMDRERLARKIREQAVALSLAASPVQEIARWNIYQATARAMGRALARLRVKELETLIEIGERVGYFESGATTPAKGLADEVGRMLTTLIQRLREPTP